MLRNSLDPDLDFWMDPDSMNMDWIHWVESFISVLGALHLSEPAPAGHPLTLQLSPCRGYGVGRLSITILHVEPDFVAGFGAGEKLRLRAVTV